MVELDMSCGKVTIYLVRHAQTIGNVGMKIVEAKEDVLTNLGQMQTNLLGMHLSVVKFDRAYSSDYGRAQKTAEGILEHSKTSKAEICTTERLREVNFGIYETALYAETFAYCQSLNKPIFQWEFPEGESFLECGQRLHKFIKEISLELISVHENTYSPTVLIVSHSAAISFFLYGLLDGSMDGVTVTGMDKQDLKLMRNCCYMKFEVEKDQIGAAAISESQSQSDVAETPVTFRILEKYYSKHLDCLKSVGTLKHINPLLEFAKGNTGGNEYVGCIQQ